MTDYRTTPRKSPRLAALQIGDKLTARQADNFRSDDVARAGLCLRYGREGAEVVAHG